MLKRDVKCTQIRNNLGALVCHDCKYCKAEYNYVVCRKKSQEVKISKFDPVCESFDCYISLSTM